MEHKDDDDDDVSFAKWMSSFWGHSWREEDERGLRERRRSQEDSHRKTSLPCPFPELPRMTSDHHPRRHSHEDQQHFRSRAHMRCYRKCSVDGSFKEPMQLKGQLHPQIQEFSESFEKQLCFKKKHSVSLTSESREEREETECLRMQMRSRKTAEEGRRAAEEEERGAHSAPLVEKGPK